VNEEQKYILADLIKDLEKKPLDELYGYLLVTRVVGFIAASLGIGLLLLSMLIPGMLMFIATGLIFPFAFRTSLVLDVLKGELKKVIATRDED